MREPGFYWVNDGERWAPAEWIVNEYGKFWSMLGNECDYKDADLFGIGERIERGCPNCVAAEALERAVTG